MNVIEWAEAHWTVRDTRTGEFVPIRLREWQKRMLSAAFPLDGSPSPWETFLVSSVKKTGKTETTAIATAYSALTLPPPETVYCLAHDLEQAQDRVFDRIVTAFRAMGLEAAGAVRVTRNEVTFAETGTRIVAMPADFAGSAGATFGATAWTELWAYRHESHVRLWEELTPIPTRRGLRIVDSYAGFNGDSPVLEKLWARALAGDRRTGDLPVWTNGRLWAYIDQGEAAQHRGWLGDPGDMEAYYAEQRETLRPGTFNRLHLNQWQSGEEVFINSEEWDVCVSEELRPMSPDQNTLIHVGVDAATKHDCAAVVAVTNDREVSVIRLVRHRIWTPRPGDPLDLEMTVEAFILRLATDYQLVGVYFDPYQMQRSAGALRRQGINMVELPQTSSNLTAAGQALSEVIRERRLVVYPDAQLRQHALNAVAVNTSRGWRLAKEKASHFIDGVVALSFAVHRATQEEPPGPPSECYSGITGRPFYEDPYGPRHGDPSQPDPWYRIDYPDG